MTAKRREPLPGAGTEGPPADIRERIEAVQQKTGFVPNVFLALAHRPAEWRAFVAYHDALMEKEPGAGCTLSKAEREMIVVATSGANHCQYCVVAHGAILRIRAKNPLIADQVAINHRKADLTPRQRAMLDFAMQVALESHASARPTSRRCARTGFTDGRRLGHRARSPRSSPCPTGSRTSPACGRTTSST